MSVHSNTIINHDALTCLQTVGCNVVFTLKKVFPHRMIVLGNSEIISRNLKETAVVIKMKEQNPVLL